MEGGGRFCPNFRGPVSGGNLRFLDIEGRFVAGSLYSAERVKMRVFLIKIMHDSLKTYTLFFFRKIFLCLRIF